MHQWHSCLRSRFTLREREINETAEYNSTETNRARLLYSLKPLFSVRARILLYHWSTVFGGNVCLCISRTSDSSLTAWRTSVKTEWISYMVDHFIYYWTELLFVDCQLLQATPNSKKNWSDDERDARYIVDYCCRWILLLSCSRMESNHTIPSST